ncbi:hypothetical protein MMC10_006918 [Thelotrema lepadinum]|nr:hypothetical protein [Thelotrema lepadinum]
MSAYLITGCSRGLGLELVKQLVLAPSSSVGVIITTSRSATPSAALKKQIDAAENRAHYVQLDILDGKSIESATQHTAQILGSSGLDVLINNAAIQILEKEGATAMPGLENSLEANVVAVHNVSRAFLPLLHRGNDKKIVNITSTLGSKAMREYSRPAPFPSYKISKAALNMLTVQYSMELESQGFTVFCVNPGWLRTDLGGAHADLEPEVGGKAVMEIVFKSTKEDNAAYRNISVPGHDIYDGKDHPW